MGFVTPDILRLSSTPFRMRRRLSPCFVSATLPSSEAISHPARGVGQHARVLYHMGRKIIAKEALTSGGIRRTLLQYGRYQNRAIKSPTSSIQWSRPRVVFFRVTVFAHVPYPVTERRGSARFVPGHCAQFQSAPPSSNTLTNWETIAKGSP